ncbi:MAG TPA: hypothetical protein EYO84_06885 [Planctomycetes bacterium]|nr:hypothetical protein [Planctomycetota bacterium]
MRDPTILDSKRQAEIVSLFNIDPGSVYDRTQDELQHLIGEFGDMEHILDAMVRLGASSMTEEQLLYARAEAIGCTIQDLLDFG